ALLPRRVALPLPPRAPPNWYYQFGLSARARGRGGARTLPGGRPRGRRGAARGGAVAHRRARLRRLFPDDARDRPLLRRGGHPLPGAWLGGELGRLLLPAHHRRRPRADGSALRALPLARARRAA